MMINERVNKAVILKLPAGFVLHKKLMCHLGSFCRGAVDIASASRARRAGIESCQGLMFLWKHSSDVLYKMNSYVMFVC
jgi:hypothetical protein